ncbi:MAG TPA: RNA polymerase sigma factor [Pyrinomonadaceae bacterium]|nr:RNA polymerase sigma factor [Pyrinomonadaceae bacterium]
MPDKATESTKDQVLLAKAAGGDQAAFMELYRDYRMPVFRFAYRLLGSVELAEDVTHDCFLSLIRRPGDFNPSRASLRTYLLAAARNLALKHFRSSGREAALDDSIEEPASPRRDQPLGRLLEKELASKVKEAILSLPPLQREALILFEYEGLSLNEIAGVVGTDVGAVKARLFRARDRLRTILQPYLNSGREIVTLERA